MNVTQTATPIDTAAPTLTCAVCPFARLIEDNRYCCQVSQTASDVKRGHWEATVSCYEALAKAGAEKVAQAPIAQTEAPATAAPTAIETDNQPPGRGDGRGRLNPIAKTDKALAAIFGERHKQYQQFLIIREELRTIGIKVGKLIKSRDDAKGWNLSWDGNKAGLYWTTGDGWDIESLKSGGELAGNWEGFDLEQQLECNGIDLEELPADLRAAS